MTEPKWNSLEEISKAMVGNMRHYEVTGTKAWDARMALRDLAYQAGGLLKLDMQLNGERHRQGQSEEEILQNIEMELAEVMALSLFAASKLGLDVKAGFQKMLDIDKAKIAGRLGIPD